MNAFAAGAVSAAMLLLLGAGAQFSPAQQPPAGTTETEETSMQIEILVNGQSFPAELYDNDSARELASRLPLELEMQELNGNEKYCYLDDSLPAHASRPGKIHAGDLMLFGSDCLVLFYESFSTSYSYTPLGAVENVRGLADALGSGSVQVTLRLS